MTQAITEAQIRQAMEIAHRERAKAFADAFKWVVGLLNVRWPSLPAARPQTC